AVLHRRADATYLDGRMSGRHRKDLRRGREQLAADLGGDLGCVDRAAEDDATFEVALTDFLRLESAGWKGRDGGAIACRAEHERFFRALAAGLRRHGRFELWSLGAAGRTAAYQCNLLAGNTAFRIKAAYDEQVARHSPGVQLELDLMAVFHDDDRLQVVDSCTAAGSMTYEQLYADRRTVETWLVPLHGRRARLAAAASPALARGYQRLRRSA
ncbi:MAG TPA: GNAT family N-acetyltransferase, partial [Gaiellales bacterium]|nr:GNAT family N-acetyltransferase [Gaiellales bacterium]